MENQKLQQAIEKYNGNNEHDLFWELAFSAACDIEEVVHHSWQLINEPPHLSIHFIALACRLCLETSNNAQHLSEALTFLGVHSDSADDANLRAIVRRLNLPLDSTYLDER